MIVETRKTANGTEYWETVDKRVRFVKAGDTPPFEVTVNPPSMLVGVDLAKGPDTTVINGEVVDASKSINSREPGDGINIEEMTVPQLKKFAKQINVEIPSDVKGKDDIIALLTAADDE